MCLGILIGSQNIMDSSSLLVIKDHYLPPKDTSVERLPCCLSVILQKTRPQMDYLKPLLSEKACPVFVKGLVFLSNFLIRTLIIYIIIFIHIATICSVWSYGRFPSFLHDFRLGQQLAFHLRELCSAVASEIHAKLARLVAVFKFPTFMCCIRSSPCDEFLFAWARC